MLDVALNFIMWHLDEDRREFNPLMPLAFLMCLFAVSAFFTWQEFKYVAWGRNATATVFDITNTGYAKYEWSDPDDGLRRDKIDAGDESEIATGAKLDIEYLPGVMASRLPGTPIHHTVAVVVFFLSLLVAVTYIALLWRRGNRELREAAEAERTKNKEARFGTPS